MWNGYGQIDVMNMAFVVEMEVNMIFVDCMALRQIVVVDTKMERLATHVRIHRIRISKIVGIESMITICKHVTINSTKLTRWLDDLPLFLPK